jgi:hypothetical protein
VKLLLVLLNLVLAAVLTAEWWFRPETPVPQPKPVDPGGQTSAASTGEAAPFRLAPEATFAVVAERPLFNKERRPPAEEEETDEAEQEQAEATPKGLSLSAVVLEDNVKLALLWDEPAKKVVRLHSGESYKGWRVAQIRADSLLLKSGDNQAELALRQYADVPPQAAQKNARNRVLQNRLRKARPPVRNTVAPAPGPTPRK